MNDIIFPFVGPIKWTKMEIDQIPQYVSKHWDDWNFVNTIRDFEGRACFHQKWLNVDSIRQQFVSNYAPLAIQTKDINGKNIGAPYAFETKQQDFYRPGYYIRELEIDTADLPLGPCYFQMNVGASSAWVSEPQEIVADMPNSLYFEYSHPFRKAGVIWETGIKMFLRVPGILKFVKIASDDFVYKDQRRNQTLVSSNPYEVDKLIIGDAYGVPPWFIKKVSYIMSLKNWKIDSRFYTRATAEFEENTADLTALSGYNIEVYEAITKEGVSVTDDTIYTGKRGMMSVIDTKGFGMYDNGGDFLEIENVE